MEVRGLSLFRPCNLEPCNPVTNPQFRLVFAVSKALGYDNDVLHALVRDWTGKTSLRQLRDDEARRLINRLKALANQTPDQAYNSPATKVGPGGEIIEYCSPAQAYMLRYLCRSLGVNLARLWAIIEARFGLTQAENTLDDLTHHDAHVLILQFKSELALAKTKQEAAARQGALGV